MKVKKIIYLIATPLSTRDAKRFGIDRVIEQGIEVEICDVSGYFGEKYQSHNTTTLTKPYNIKKFYRLNDIRKNISQEKGLIIVSMLGDGEIRAIKILNHLYKNNIFFGFIYSALLPAPAKNISIKKIFSIRIFSYLLRVVVKMLYKFNYSFVMCAGDIRYNQLINDKKFQKTNIIKSHAFDYDLFLEKVGDNKYGDYVVFLDEYFPFHPDFALLGIDYTHIAKEYYNNLNKLFDQVEKDTGAEVIIAAHPRSYYYSHDVDYFLNRKIIKNQTINLVKHAKFCIMHASTSINFVTLYHKPVMFVTMDCIANSATHQILITMAKELQASVFNIDQNNMTQAKDNTSYNKESYQSYIDTYIKCSGSAKINTTSLLLQSLENTHNV